MTKYFLGFPSFAMHTNGINFLCKKIQNLNCLISERVMSIQFSTYWPQMTVHTMMNDSTVKWEHKSIPSKIWHSFPFDGGIAALNIKRIFIESLISKYGTIQIQLNTLEVSVDTDNIFAIEKLLTYLLIF